MCDEEIGKSVSQCRKLKTLAINGTDASFQHISTMKHLEKLVLGDTNRSTISDEAFSSISNMHNLKELELNNLTITDEGFAHIGDLEQLEELIFFGLIHVKVGEKVKNSMKNLANLKFVNRHLDVRASRRMIRL